MEAIKIKNLIKTYSDKKDALSGLDLTVKQGEIFSLLGTNGAGKTTLINILTTFVKPTKGVVQILGKSLEDHPQFVRFTIACVAQQVSADDNLTLEENMRFQAGLYSLDKVKTKERMGQLIELFNLSDYSNKKVAVLSGGLKRRLDIAMSMISYPKILFLDEPTVGMDLQSRRNMWEMLRKIKIELGVTIFLTTHYLEEADMLSDTICFIKEGKTVLQDTPANLKHLTRKSIIRINVMNSQDIERIKNLLAKKDYIKRIDIKEQRLNIQVNDSQKAFPDLNAFVLASKIKFEEIGIVKPTLDDIFLEIISKGRD